GNVENADDDDDQHCTDTFKGVSVDDGDTVQETYEKVTVVIPFKFVLPKILIPT
ncbi:hypothetical protein HDU76_006936, partial [Blyttiomyces sp. JEL0837]